MLIYFIIQYQKFIFVNITFDLIRKVFKEWGVVKLKFYNWQQIISILSFFYKMSAKYPNLNNHGSSINHSSKNGVP